MRRALPLVPIVALIALHARGLLPAWRGEGAFSRPFGSDLFPELRLADLTWAYLGEAWRSAATPLHFLLHDMWEAPARSEAWNQAHFLLIWWPLRALLPTGAALLVEAMVLLAMNTAAGWWMGRRLGGTSLAGAAGAAVAGGCGLFAALMESGQFPQAWLAPSLIFAGALPGCLAGRRRDLVIGGLGLALSTLSYWYHGLILGLLGGAWLLGTWLAEPERVSRRGLLAIAVTGVVVSLALVPAVIPILPLLHDPTASVTVQVPPWNTPWPAYGTAAWQALQLDRIVLDEVPLDAVLDPREGWLPALPLLPLAVLGARRREARPWLAVALVGLLLMVGPSPVTSDVQGTAGFDGGRLGKNPVAIAAWRWLPLYSRMIHPRRMGLLVVAAGVALCAFGARDLGGRRGAALIAAGLAWSGFVGPLPLSLWPFPGRAVAPLETCGVVVHTPFFTPGVSSTLRLREYLVTLHRRPAFPMDPSRGEAASPYANNADAGALSAGTSRDPAEAMARLGPDACLVLDEWSSRPTDARRNELTAALGEPVAITLPGSSFPDTGRDPRTLWLWRTPSAAASAIPR